MRVPVWERVRASRRPVRLGAGCRDRRVSSVVGLGGIELSFAESRDWLTAFLLFGVSENTIRSETQALGAVQAAREDARCLQSQDLAYLQGRLRETTPLPARLYGSLDAAKVRIEPRPRMGKSLPTLTLGAI